MDKVWCILYTNYTIVTAYIISWHRFEQILKYFIIWLNIRNNESHTEDQLSYKLNLNFLN